MVSYEWSQDFYNNTSSNKAHVSDIIKQNKCENQSKIMESWKYIYQTYISKIAAPSRSRVQNTLKFVTLWGFQN